MKKLFLTIVGMTLVVTAACEETGDHSTLVSNQMLIVTTKAFESGANVYADYRRLTGFGVEVISIDEVKARYSSISLVESLKRQVREYSQKHSPEQSLYVLLIGDAVSDEPENLDFVPVASDAWGIFGDNPYADLDDDGVPDLSIGRLPFRESSSLEQYFARVKEYEAHHLPQSLNKMVNVFEGTGGFGPENDALLYTASTWIIDAMSYDFDMTITHALEGSDFYLPPKEWEDFYSHQYENGALAQIYIGHSKMTSDCCRGGTPGRRGLLAFFSCSDGEFQLSTGLTLTEDLLIRPEGPIVTLAATTLSHPYGNVILPWELGYALLELREPTFGQTIQKAKYNSVHRTDDNMRKNIDAIAKAILGDTLDQIIYTHLTMYNLFGDPALPTFIPKGKIEFLKPQTSKLVAGQKIQIEGNVWEQDETPQLGGEIFVTLEIQRSEVLSEIVPCTATSNACSYNHQIANNKIISHANNAVKNGSFSVELDVPTGLPNKKYYLKAYARDAENDALGSKEVSIIP